MKEKMNRLKELRKDRGLTQAQLAEKIGVSKITVLRWENNERQIKEDRAKELADFFGVPIGYLLGFSDNIATDLALSLYKLDSDALHIAKKYISDAKKINKELVEFASTNDISSQIDSIIQNEGLGEFLYNLDKVFVQIESKEEYSEAEKEALDRLDHEILAFIDMLFEKRLLIQKLKRD